EGASHDSERRGAAEPMVRWVADAHVAQGRVADERSEVATVVTGAHRGARDLGELGAPATAVDVEPRAAVSGSVDSRTHGIACLVARRANAARDERPELGSQLTPRTARRRVDHAFASGAQQDGPQHALPPGFTASMVADATKSSTPEPGSQ